MTTDDLLARADDVAEMLDIGYPYYDAPQTVRDLAAKVRELQADVVNSGTRETLLLRRAERAEAALESEREQLNTIGRSRDAACQARDSARAECESLRALLREFRNGTLERYDARIDAALEGK